MGICHSSFWEHSDVFSRVLEVGDDDSPAGLRTRRISRAFFRSADFGIFWKTFSERGKNPLDGKATAYVWKRGACERPARNLETVRTHLNELPSTAAR